jgi:transposase
VPKDVCRRAEVFDISMILAARMFIEIVLDARRHTMEWLRVQLTEGQQRVVNEERRSHPNARIREKMLVLWLLHKGITRQQAAQVVGIGRATVQRYVAAFREGGLDGLRQWNVNRPVSEMAAYRDLIRESFEKQPVCTVAEAAERIFQLTGLRRGPSQVRKFLKDLGLKFQRVRVIPVPPKKTWQSTSKPKPNFSTPS